MNQVLLNGILKTTLNEESSLVGADQFIQSQGICSQRKLVLH
ncbi:hypothetical protein VHARVF571_490018 [Vibrio harveyi]|nr:hypothetical protein VHARVF571_490018 [Vibrio harveyi]